MTLSFSYKMNTGLLSESKLFLPASSIAVAMMVVASVGREVSKSDGDRSAFLIWLTALTNASILL